jgi:predicted metal-dependent hydrolase
MTEAAPHKAHAPIKPRAPSLDFSEAPKYWFAGSRAATHMWNGVNLLFPGGERFFIRSVRHYQGRLSPELEARVKGFFGQEGRHAQAHERVFEMLRAQGFDIDVILEPYNRIVFGRLEKIVPAALRLSITVAAEHFTALMAEDALTVDVTKNSDPDVRNLFLWHAVEELEHKSVAFDVLQEVAPSYALRVSGMILGALLLGTCWTLATRELLRQDGSSLLEAKRELDSIRLAAKKKGVPSVAARVGSRVFGRGIMKYMRRDFHPDQRDHSGLIAEALARLAAEGVIPAESMPA